MARVFALRKRLREPTAARSLARSLARSPRSAAPPLREKPHFKPFRPYERLRPRDEIELHLGAPAFAFASGSTAEAAQPFSPEKHAREGMRAFCFARFAEAPAASCETPANRPRRASRPKPSRRSLPPRTQSSSQRLAHLREAAHDPGGARARALRRVTLRKNPGRISRSGRRIARDRQQVTKTRDT